MPTKMGITQVYYQLFHVVKQFIKRSKTLLDTFGVPSHTLDTHMFFNVKFIIHLSWLYLLDVIFTTILTYPNYKLT